MTNAGAAPVEAVLVGAGERGTGVFGAWSLRHPARLRFVAVAEPDDAKRARFAAAHSIPAERCYSSWEDLIAAGQLAPALVCCTQDRLHREPAVAALRLGYHVLLEKPMAVTTSDCIDIVRESESAKRLLLVSHVLRYTGFFATIKEIISSGRLGKISTIEHRENVSYWHMAHSFVRGNWANSEESCPMILAKCCHDLDLILWMMDDPVRRLHSLGSLMHFTRQNAPAGATDRCTDGCPAAEQCPFYAPRYYLNMARTQAPVTALGHDLSYEGRLRALQTGPYGRCVYKLNNNVVDHQVVTMEHEGGAISTLIMHGHSHEEGRTLRIDGSLATLRASFLHNTPHEIRVYDHVKDDIAGEVIPIPNLGEGGHGGGDGGLIEAFVKAVRSPAANTLTSARQSLASHLLAFAAEESRTTGNAIDFQEFTAKLHQRL